ncbi:hypothetical protein BR93DRAFT_932894 [Coniochaeta sp. PMI_546]|nr:hypothetical protein BR93DRAFT_932894 [Coniochaeta sp. PMI_546]
MLDSSSSNIIHRYPQTSSLSQSLEMSAQFIFNILKDIFIFNDILRVEWLQAAPLPPLLPTVNPQHTHDQQDTTRCLTTANPDDPRPDTAPTRGSSSPSSSQPAPRAGPSPADNQNNGLLPDRRRQSTTDDGSALVEGGDAGGRARASGWDGHRLVIRTNYVGSLVVVVAALVVGVLGFRLWARMGGFLKGEGPEPGSDS